MGLDGACNPIYGMMMWDLNGLVMFVGVADEGSYVGAARKLNIPTSTLSRRVAALEDELGVRLLQRSSRKVSMTDPGRSLYEHCRPLAQQLDEARRMLIDKRAKPSGRLRVTASPLLGDQFLREPICEFLSTYPDVELDVFLTGRNVRVIEEGFDLAIRAGELRESSLIARRIARTQLCLCATPGFVERCGEPKDPEDLRDYPCAIYEGAQDPAVWNLVRMDGVRSSVRTRGPLVVNDQSLLASLVLSGRAIGNLPSVLVHEALEAGTLVRLLPEWSSPEQWIHALYPSRRNLSVTLRVFLDLVSENISQNPALHSAVP